MRSVLVRFISGLLAAFAVAVCSETLLTCVYVGIFLLAFGPTQNTDVSDGFLLIAVSAAYASAGIALPAVFLVGLPYAIVSNYLGKNSRRYYLGSGVVLGLLVTVVAGIWHYRHPGPPIRASFDNGFFVISSMIAGALASLAFWVSARPDRLHKPSFGA